MGLSGPLILWGLRCWPFKVTLALHCTLPQWQHPRHLRKAQHGDRNHTRRNRIQQQRQARAKESRKGERAPRAPAVPQELRGKWHKTPTGDRICFAFNCKSGCSDAIVKPGERCAKGFHVCAKPRCQKAHSLEQHHAAGGA